MSRNYKAKKVVGETKGEKECLKQHNDMHNDCMMG